MKTSVSREKVGFSLIEIIGVLSIVAILSAVLAPNILKSIDRAKVAGESDNLRVLGDQIKLYLRENNALPTPSNLADQLSLYSDLNADAIANNRQNVARSFIRDRSTLPVVRILILSSMRNGLNLPVEANIGTVAFDEIWNTAAGQIPPASSWGGWNSWSSVEVARDYLVIQRVNLQTVYQTDLLTYTVSLNNISSVECSYNIVSADGSSIPAVDLHGNSTQSLTGFMKGDRINLYRSSNGANLGYSYVVSVSGMTFDFDGSAWRPL